ncbi:Protease inhibitor protein [Plasmopara halstedii]|uniref:Protease inhibitor protein n=1 Tax=Plasmopara halstedii TaxID=4781 RepID=A0A0P1AHM8_PLAHL|nr:Protease inhibitor protein [Plasmopara halstedii]CEG39988.1 Protease inhibitor protein [Plasmopara halstedii]|eukprot:XP_024576357.1 Protease inhibitor protein [Plasmopara halstedii]
MAFVRSIGLFVSLALAITIPQIQSIVGSYTLQNPTDEDIKLLTKAAGNASMYQANVTARICLYAVESLQTQVVAGINYKFQVAGCNVMTDKELGACIDRNCEHFDYNIVLFSQPWTDTLQVTSITPAD